MNMNFGDVIGEVTLNQESSTLVIEAFIQNGYTVIAKPLYGTNKVFITIVSGRV